MKQSIILIGGGGHCKSCIDVIEQEGTFSIKGIVDKPEKKGQDVLGYTVIANNYPTRTRIFLFHWVI